MAIPNEEILKLKESIKLSEVIRARGVELKRKGRQLFGICPFHSEDSPSLAVDDEKGLWNCLGKCATGGDVFSFIQKSDGISFKEAFSLIDSGKLIMDNPKPKPKTKTSAASITSANSANYLEKAVEYYHKSLLKNEKAIEYLNSRGISAEAMRTFKLGRIWYWYESVTYLPSEINQLLEECLKFKEEAQNPDQLTASDKLITACNEALKTDSGIFLASD